MCCQRSLTDQATEVTDAVTHVITPTDENGGALSLTFKFLHAISLHLVQ